MPVIKLRPACKDYIWGGNKLINEYNKPFCGDRIAETWELSCHPDGLSYIANGYWAGKTLKEYIASDRKRILGSHCDSLIDFPILIKLIDATNNLSVQVHPDDDYAMKNEHQYGKTEMWYVLSADDDAYIYYGLKEEISKELFAAAVNNGSIIDLLKPVNVHKGDVFYIPSGTLHAICKGIVIAEIQQNSNVTYRVYDYDRIDKNGNKRELHKSKAIDVANLEPSVTHERKGDILVSCKYFTTSIQKAPFTLYSGKASFISILVVDGHGTILCEAEEISFNKGDSLFIPANSGIVSVKGKAECLITSI